MSSYLTRRIYMKIALVFRSKKRNEFSIENLFSDIEKHFKISYQKYFVPYGRYNRLRFLIGNINYVKKIRADIVHITGEIYYVVPFIKSKNIIITLHDFVNLEQMNGIKKLISWTFWNYIPFKKANYIVCISPKVFNETVERFPFTKNKLIYIPNPVGDEYQYTQKNFNKKNPNILAIGTRINKNLERIIEAVKDINCTLTIIGILTDYQAKLLESSGVVYENYFRIPNSKVLELYKNSDIVCFPSLYEGFGRPIVEAQAIGRAVVTSNLEPMKQVAGDSSACLVDPYDVLDIRKGIMKVIEDDKYREGIIEKGLENVKQYRADIIAKKYEDVYKKMI